MGDGLEKKREEQDPRGSTLTLGLAVLSVRGAVSVLCGPGGHTPCWLWGCPGCRGLDSRTRTTGQWSAREGFRPTVVCPEPRDDGSQPPAPLQWGLLRTWYRWLWGHPARRGVQPFSLCARVALSAKGARCWKVPGLDLMKAAMGGGLCDETPR